MKIHTQKHFRHQVGFFGSMFYYLQILGFYKHKKTYDCYLVLWNPLSYLFIFCFSIYLVLLSTCTDETAQDLIIDLFNVFKQPKDEVLIRDLPKE